jgi:type IV pilus assembly protein PilV
MLMVAHHNQFGRIKGVALLEVMISLVILLVGLLGLAGLLVQSNRSEFESYQKKQALILLQDMADRISNNVNAANCYALGAGAANYVGDTATVTNPASYACAPGVGTAFGANQIQRVRDDLVAWDGALKGAAEVLGTDKVGAALDARGCIEYLGTFVASSGAASAAVFGTKGTYTDFLVSVAWRGTGDSAAPPGTLVCAKNTYGTEGRRRVVSRVVRIPSLNI